MANFEPLFLDSTGWFKQEDGTREAELHTIQTPSELDLMIRDGPVYAEPGSITVAEFVDWKVSSSCPNAADNMDGNLFKLNK